MANHLAAGDLAHVQADQYFAEGLDAALRHAVAIVPLTEQRDVCTVPPVTSALPVPKYHQIYLVLREQLHEGRFERRRARRDRA